MKSNPIRLLTFICAALGLLLLAGCGSMPSDYDQSWPSSGGQSSPGGGGHHH